jgi:hypothetical protein
MRGYYIEDNVTGFHTILRDLLDHGHGVGSRAGETVELENVVIHMSSPARSAALSRPHYEHGIGLMEGAQLVAGIVDPDLLRLVAPKIDDYSDFYGAYGPRLATQLPVLIERLTADPSSRQAVLEIWDAEKDQQGGHRDHPCTMVITFRIRAGRLNMSVHMRSNDIWFGWAYDAVQFTILQHTVASILGVLPGTYVHHADSFHLYTRHLEEAMALAYGNVPPQSIIDYAYSQSYVDGFSSGENKDLIDAQMMAIRAMRGDINEGEAGVTNTAWRLSNIVREKREEAKRVASEDAAIARAKEMP